MRPGIRKLLVVARVQEPDFGRGGDIDAAPSQTIGDRAVTVLIEMEADHSSHGPPVP
jgi:hypothetical protein